VALAGLAVMVAVVVVVLWPGSDRVTRVNYDRLRGGMSRGEVAAIFGAPGDYRTRPTECLGRCMSDHRDFDEADATTDDEVWDGDTATIQVDCGSVGTVVYVSYQGTEPLDQGSLDNLLWRAKRQWHRWFPE
jgi:hypothetical protein